MRNITSSKQKAAASVRRRGGAGAALVIALAASAVVLLSVALLLGYINRMTNEQAERESLAQARLSQASAGDMIGALLASGQVPFMEENGLLAMAGQTTRMAYVSSAELPPLRIDLATIQGMDRFIPVESTGGIALAGIRGGRLEAWEFDPRTGSVLSGFPVDVCEVSGDFLAAGFGRGSGWLLAAAFEGPEGVRASLVGADGPVIEVALGMPSLEGYTRAEAGMADGQPIMIISGTAAAAAVYFISGETEILQSPPGTSPVVTGGRVWPNRVQRESSEPGEALPVLDLLRGDWDADGSEDICWICPGKVSVLLSTDGRLVEDSSPGARPGAWGASLGAPGGLAVRWTGSTGINAWRSLSSGRFTTFTGGGALALPWEGRLTGGAGLVAGVMDGATVLYTASGRPLADLGASASTEMDIDGGSPDLVLRECEGWSVVLNPSDGPGESNTWRLTTLDRGGRLVLSGHVTFSAFRDAGGGIRLMREDS